MKKIILYFSIIGFAFALEIDKMIFTKEVNPKKVTKEIFKLKNNSLKNVVSYSLKIEGNKNVKVFPKTIVLKGLESKNYVVEITGTEKGKHYYDLVIDERVISDESKPKNKKIDGNKDIEIEIKLNKRLRLKQMYQVK